MKSNQNHKRIAAALDRLFRTYPQFGQGNTPEEITRDRVEKAKVYFDAVAPYDERDIEAAIDNFLAGSAPGHNPSFAPPAPVVGAETRRVMNLRLDSEHRERLAQPRLPPPDIERSPASQARVRAKMAAALQSLADRMLTEDAAANRRRLEMQRKTDALLGPDTSPKATADRLGFRYTAGDREIG